MLPPLRFWPNLDCRIDRSGVLPRLECTLAPAGTPASAAAGSSVSSVPLPILGPFRLPLFGPSLFGPWFPRLTPPLITPPARPAEGSMSEGAAAANTGVATEPGSPAEAASPPATPRRFAAAEILMIGDSQSVGTTSGLDRLNARARRHDGAPLAEIDSHPLSGRKTSDFLDWLATPAGERMVRGRDLVFVQLGGNDLSGGRSAAQIIAGLDAVVRRIREINPDAEIAVSAIPVRWSWIEDNRDNAAQVQRRLETVNNWIAGGGFSQNRFDYFPVNQYIGICDDDAARAAGRVCSASDPDDNNDQARAYRRRGASDVHLNDDGYEEVARRFVETYVAR